MKEYAIAVKALRRLAKLEECCEIERGEDNTRHDVSACRIAEDALTEMGLDISENATN